MASTNNGYFDERTTALTASDAGASDQFGISCALSDDGSVLAVGANAWDGAATDQGAVYIFDWDGSSWTERTTALTASDAGASDQFGVSCALSSDGSVLAVGANAWEGAASDQGAVYVFDWDGSSWTERTTALTASDAGANDLFGYSCAISRDGMVLAVGAILWDGAAGTNEGAIYVFDYNGSTWVERTTALTPSTPDAYDYFGYSIALSGDGAVLAVSAPRWDDASYTDRGAVYIFDWDGSSWTERSGVITASDPDDLDYFGSACALSNDGSVLAVGALYWDGPGGSDQGAVYVFDWDGSSWTERTTALTASDAGASDSFGYSCALSSDGSVLAVGAHFWDGAAGTNQGAVYVFDWSSSEASTINRAPHLNAFSNYNAGWSGTNAAHTLVPAVSGQTAVVRSLMVSVPTGLRVKLYDYNGDLTPWLSVGDNEVLQLPPSLSVRASERNQPINLMADGSTEVEVLCSYCYV